MERPKIVYLHIPRSAGNSIIDMFSFLNRMIFDKYDNFKIDNPTKPVQFIKLTSWLSTQNSFSFTFLRHPIQLFYSQYYALKEESEIPKASWRSLQYDKNSFINSLIKQTQSANEYIDLILDIGPIFSYYIFPKGYFAQDTLSQLDFVGVIDYFKEGVEIISEKIDYPLAIPKLVNTQLVNTQHDVSYRYDELAIFLKEEISMYEKIKMQFEHDLIKGIKVLILSKDIYFLNDYISSIKDVVLHFEITFNTYDVVFMDDTNSLGKLNPNVIIIAYKATPRSIKGYDITFRVKIENITFVHYTKSKRDVTFIIQGSQNLEKLKYQHCIYGIFGNVELSTWDLYDEASIKEKIVKEKIVNDQNVYLQMYTTKKGLERVSTPWVIKVRSDEIYSDWQDFIAMMKDDSDNPDNSNKLICSNVFFRRKAICLHNSDHIMGGRKETLKAIVSNCMKHLEQGKPKSINNMLLWRAPEVWITTSHLENLYGFEKTFMNLNIGELKKMMQDSFHIVSVELMGKYLISYMQNFTRREITRETKYKFRTDVFELYNINQLD